MSKWTKEQVDYLEKWHKLKSYEEIGKKIGKPECAVKTYASRHGISCNWTREEDAYLEKWFMYKSNKAIAKSLKRTESAISSRATKLGLGNRNYCNDDIDMTELSRLVGKQTSVVSRRWVNEGLIYYKRCKYRMVKPKDLYRFMQENPDLWDATKCEKYYFENEEWFRKKLLEDRKKMCDKRWGIESA